MTNHYDELVNEALARVQEIMPWDLSRALAASQPCLLVDVREPAEFTKLHIPGAINVPRGVLEQSCEWDYDETVPQLARDKGQRIVLICRSGKRSVLAADSLGRMGFSDVVSLRTGVRGWNDYEQPLVNASGEALNADAADVLLEPAVTAEQRYPAANR
jgi:rhodanese-related sulfurtransferase